MPRQCAVCVHPERQAIDRAILAGEPKSVISRRWGLPPDATERHAKVGHVVRHEQIIAGKSVLAPREGDDLLEKLEELVKIVREVMGRCIQFKTTSTSRVWPVRVSWSGFMNWWPS